MEHRMFYNGLLVNHRKARNARKEIRTKENKNIIRCQRLGDTGHGRCICTNTFHLSDKSYPVAIAPFGSGFNVRSSFSGYGICTTNMKFRFAEYEIGISAASITKRRVCGK